MEQTQAKWKGSVKMTGVAVTRPGGMVLPESVDTSLPGANATDSCTHYFIQHFIFASHGTRSRQIHH